MASDQNDQVQSEFSSNVNKVAHHYNSMKPSNVVERTKSRIFHLRNLNNWVKSMLIGDAMQWLQDNPPDGASGDDGSGGNQEGGFCVLDMCSGKGGDLIKWKKSNVRHVVLVDIADQSVEQSRQRYAEMVQRSAHERFQQRAMYTAEFVVADCGRHALEKFLPQPEMKFDLVSVQFSLHYFFESAEQALTIIKSVSRALKPGGYFIGSTTDANEIVRRLSCPGVDNCVSNEIYSIKMAEHCKLNQFSKFCQEKPTKPALFGCQYDFHLVEVVNCPEYLLHFPLLTEMCEREGLRLVMCENFSNYFKNKSQCDKFLLSHMECLEAYPERAGESLMSPDASQYAAAEEFLRKHGGADISETGFVGTLSQAEWEVFCLYLVFAFQKV